MISGEGKRFELIRVPDGDRGAWLEERRRGVGGSDVAAIMGLSPWKSAYQVWAEKRFDFPDDISGNPAVEWGNILEPVVGRHYSDAHPEREVRRVNAVLRSIDRPWAQASLDYEVRDPELGWGVLEIKTAGCRSAWRWEDGVPTFYLTQVTHYLSVSGRPFADVAVLIGGSDYREYRVMRDEEDVKAVDGAVDAFWADNVLGGEEPEPTAADGPTVFEVKGEAKGGYIETTETPVLVSRYLLACAEYDHAKAEKDRWAAKLKAEIGDAKGYDTPGGRMTWTRSNRKKYDYKRMDEENPGLRDRYMSSAPADMGLRWREKKEK